MCNVLCPVHHVRSCFIPRSQSSACAALCPTKQSYGDAPHNNHQPKLAWLTKAAIRAVAPASLHHTWMSVRRGRRPGCAIWPASASALAVSGVSSPSQGPKSSSLTEGGCCGDGASRGRGRVLGGTRQNEVRHKRSGQLGDEGRRRVNQCRCITLTQSRCRTCKGVTRAREGLCRRPRMYIPAQAPA